MEPGDFRPEAVFQLSPDMLCRLHRFLLLDWQIIAYGLELEHGHRPA